MDGLDTPLEVDTKIANALLGLATEAFVAAQLASRDASITALQGAKADATLLASYATNAALSASKTALQSALDAILAELAALQLSGSGVVNAPAWAGFTTWELLRGSEAALRGIIQRQRKITETSKKLEMKKLYQVLIILDDYADSPQLHKPHGALDTLFIRGRHLQISTWVSSQKLRLISAAVRVNMQFLCCWRLRNQHELEAVIEELSALLPKDKLHRIYEQATREPYSFLFVYYLKPKNQMFHLRFEERFALESSLPPFRMRWKRWSASPSCWI